MACPSKSAIGVVGRYLGAHGQRDNGREALTTPPQVPSSPYRRGSKEACYLWTPPSPARRRPVLDMSNQVTPIIRYLGPRRYSVLAAVIAQPPENGAPPLPNSAGRTAKFYTQPVMPDTRTGQRFSGQKKRGTTGEQHGDWDLRNR